MQVHLWAVIEGPGGIGGRLLLAAEAGGIVLVIDARNERAGAWYASYGSVPLLDAPLTLLLPLGTVEAALRRAGKYLGRFGWRWYCSPLQRGP